MTRRLVAEFAPCQIYLFGSYAWEQPNEDSDVDLFVIVPDSHESRRDRELERTSRVYASLQCEILECGAKLYDGLSTALQP